MSGQCINPTPSSGLGGHPATGKPPRLLETMQRGVDRPFREIERLAAPAPDFLDHRVAMRRARRERSEHNHVEVSFEHFTFHAVHHYALSPEGRKGQACRRGVGQSILSSIPDAAAYLARGTKTWPLMPKPPSAVS